MKAVPLVLLVAAAFGPYTPVPGVRVEQIAAYGLFFWGVARLRWLRAAVDGYGAATVGLLGATAAIAVVGLVAPPVDMSGIASGGALGGLDNLLLPIAVVVATWACAAGVDDVRPLVRAVCLTLVLGAVVNAVLAAVSLGHDLSPFLSTFWDNSTTDQAVAQRAGDLGRYTGIVNQPAEAGELYSIALLAAIHLLRDRPARLAVVATALTVGGVLTVSKIFLLVGLPIAVWQAVVPERGAKRGRAVRRFAALGTVAVGAWAAGEAGWLPHWSGADFLARLFDPSSGGRSALDLYTAGRFGERGTLSTAVDAVVHTSPWFGFGAKGLALPYDNGWVEAFVVAGACGALCYTGVLAVLGSAWLHRRRHLPDGRGRFAGGLVLVLAGASVGLPALTANRAATLAWILVTLLLFRPVPVPAPVYRELVAR